MPQVAVFQRPALAVELRGTMGLLKDLFSRKAEPRQRVRICIECGMPVAEHKAWCSIWQIQQAQEKKAAAASASTEPERA
jgi:hypothetical protein